MDAKRLAELEREAHSVPEGVAVRIDAKELLWLIENRQMLFNAVDSGARAAESVFSDLLHARMLARPK